MSVRTTKFDFTSAGHIEMTTMYETPLGGDWMHIVTTSSTLTHHNNKSRMTTFFTWRRANPQARRINERWYATRQDWLNGIPYITI